MLVRALRAGTSPSSVPRAGCIKLVRQELVFLLAAHSVNESVLTDNIAAHQG